ncbi:MAG: substrate-binding periplasmic protein [Pseudomonas sp.]
MRTGIIILLGLLNAAVAAEQRHYSIGVEPQPYAPYYSTQAGEYRGYARELLDAFAAAKGYRFDYRPMPVNRLFREFLGGRLDFKFPDNPQWKAELKGGQRIHYSQSLTPYIDGTLVPRQHQGQGKARIKSLGALLGFTPSAYLDDISQGRIHLSQTSQIDALLKMALSERVDAVYLNVQVAEHHLRQLGTSTPPLVFDPTLPYDRGDYYLSSLHHPQIIAELNAFLREQAALVKRLKRQYRVEWQPQGP